MQFDMKSILKFLQSDGGQATTDFAGAGLQAFEQNRQNNKQLAQQSTQFNQGLQQNAGQGVQNANPLGTDQQFRQRQALQAAILPNLRNAHSTPGDAGIAAAMGQHSGGMMNALPEGGLDPMLIDKLFGSQATEDSITQNHKQLGNIDPRAFSGAASNSDPFSAFHDQVMNDSELSKAFAAIKAASPQDKGQAASMFQQLLQAKGITPPQVPEGYKFDMATGSLQKKSSVLGKIGKIAGMVAPFALAPFTGGLSMLAQGAIGAGIGAGTSAMQHQNPLMGAIMGGVGSGVKLPGFGKAASTLPRAPGVDSLGRAVI